MDSRLLPAIGIGVPAVERLLGGMVIEQRDVNGNVVEIKRSL